MRSRSTAASPPKPPRGSVLSLLVVISVVITGLILATAWSASIQANMASRLPKFDAAYYAAEAGAQHAAWKFRKDNQWRAPALSPLQGSLLVDGTTWNYTVTCTDSIGDATLAWKFDENAGASTADSSGHGNLGTFHGGVSWDPSGRSGNAVALNGIDGYIDCGNGPTTNLTSDFTFSAWVKMNSGAYDQKIGGNQDGVAGGYKLCIYNSKVELEVRDPSNVARLDRDVPGGKILVMGSWYHVAGVYNRAAHTIKTYVNGKFDRQLTGLPDNALGSTSGNFVMGREPWKSAYYFNGSLDDIRVFDRVLSDNEINALYDTTVDIACSATDGSTTNAVAYSVSIPTPPAPSVPAVTAVNDLNLKDTTFTGDLSIRGAVKGQSPKSTVNGNLTYGDKLTGIGNITITGSSTKVATPTNIPMPSLDLNALHNQATSYGQVVTGNSTGQTFSFNSLGGNKVIWIKGDLINPTITIGGTYASGGTFVVDGKVSFTSGNQSAGADGYPVYFVSSNDFLQSGTSLTLFGGIYSLSNLTFNSLTLTGPAVVAKNITNNDTAPSTFNANQIPWFDNRVLPQPTATLPMYSTNHHGIGP